MNTLTCIRTILLSLALTCTGCASTLVVSGNIDGLPLPTAAPFVELFARNTFSKGGPCSPTLSFRHITIAGHTDRYVNVKSAAFAKTGLSVKYNEKGLVSEVSFNTEPSPDAIKAATDAASTILPFLGILSKTEAEDPSKVNALDTGAFPACDAGEVPLRLIPQADYLDSQKLQAIVEKALNQLDLLR